MTSSSSGSCGSDRKRSVTHIRKELAKPRDMPASAPIDDADEGRDDHRGEADRKRDAPAIDHPRQQVLAEIVGAEGMGQGRALQVAVKSMSLIATGQSRGPTTTPRHIRPR